jgi:hypothetical protein
VDQTGGLFRLQNRNPWSECGISERLCSNHESRFADGQAPTRDQYWERINMAMKLMKSGDRAKPGKWYFFVICRKCHKDIIFAEAPSFEEEEEPKVRGVKATCPHCQTAGSAYRANEVRRGQVDGNT